MKERGDVCTVPSPLYVFILHMLHPIRGYSPSMNRGPSSMNDLIVHE